MVSVNVHPLLEHIHTHKHTQENAVFPMVLVDVAKMAVKKERKACEHRHSQSRGPDKAAVMCYPTSHLVSRCVWVRQHTHPIGWPAVVVHRKEKKHSGKIFRPEETTPAHSRTLLCSKVVVSVFGHLPLTYFNPGTATRRKGAFILPLNPSHFPCHH